MDNTQLTAPDGSWLLFADWQGMTRITVFGHRVLGAAAAGPVHEALLEMDPAHAQDVARMLGQPDVP